jgi:hypothetical protein
LSDDAEGGIFVFNREPEAGIILVVPQFYVVPWMMFLDEMVLQNEGLFLRIGDDRVDVCHPFDQGERLDVFAIGPLKVGVDAVSQIASFSNVENGPLRVFEKVDTRMGRKMFQFLLQRSHGFLIISEMVRKATLLVGGHRNVGEVPGPTARSSQTLFPFLNFLIEIKIIILEDPSRGLFSNTLGRDRKSKEGNHENQGCDDQEPGDGD